MTAAPFPADEDERLRALRELAILDTPTEERFDRITRLANRLFDVPIALVSLVDDDRQWFKSRVGVETEEVPREISVCSHAILEPDVLVVPDATQDERFRDNPIVTDEPKIRFYAGYPIRSPGGHPIGTLCIMDHEPRDFGELERSSLVDLGAMVEREVASHALANLDPLTGIRNRRGFELAADPMLAASTRMGLAVTLIFIDLDDFKSINDVHGHAEGDRGLREVASALTAVFRAGDVVARLGGDEFCVLMSGTDERSVQEPLARLSDAISGRNDSPGAEFPIRYSTGFVSFHDGATIADLLAEADRRMYRHKRRIGSDATPLELAQVLLELAGSLTNPTPRSTRLERLCEQTVELLGCDRSSIFLLEAGEYRAVHNFGNPPDIAEHFPSFRVPADDRLASAAIQSRACVVVNDAVDSDLVGTKTAMAARIRSIVVAPLAAGKEPLGFMTAEYNERSGVFTELDATLLQGVARLVSGVLQGDDRYRTGDPK